MEKENRHFSREVLEEKLGMIDYRYDAEKNQFE